MLRLFGLNKKSSPKKLTAKKLTTKNYAAVEIIPSEKSCSEAKSKAGLIFLSSEAPLIPMEFCTSRYECACKYVHYKDRRQDGRRATDFGLPDRFSGKDRRMVGDRRIH